MRAHRASRAREQVRTRPAIRRPAGWPRRSLSPIVDARDASAERVQTLVDALIAAFDLAGVVDRARALRAQRREEHRHPGTDVWRLDDRRAERGWSRHERPMRIAQHDACAHANELVDEE